MIREPRWYESEDDIYEPRMGHNDYEEVELNNSDESKAISQPKSEYWSGYYDFLINEGSYKFWAVFQVQMIL